MLSRISAHFRHDQVVQMAGRIVPKPRRVGRGLGLAVIATLFLFAGVAQAKPIKSYAVTDLGTLGGANSEANAINNNGQITGTSETGAVDTNGNPVLHAFRYSDGTMIDLGTPFDVERGCPCSSGFAINDAGDVAGSALSSSQDLFPVLWKNGTISFLGGAGSEPRALGINNAGDVVGEGVAGLDACGISDPGWLSRDGTLTLINFPNGDGGRGAFDVNNKGKVVGGACLTIRPDSLRHAYVYDDGTITDLGTLGGTNSTATAISDSGKIVGYSQVSGEAAEHAFRYSGGSMHDLGTLGGTNSRALAVNKSGRVVGWSDSTAGGTRAFLFSRSSTKDLNAYVGADSGWVLEKATGINDDGQIVGTGTHSGNTRAFLLTPVR